MRKKGIVDFEEIRLVEFEGKIMSYEEIRIFGFEEKKECLSLRK